jgi:hypothetical protein
VSKTKGEKTLVSKSTPRECVESLYCTKHEMKQIYFFGGFKKFGLLSQHTRLYETIEPWREVSYGILAQIIWFIFFFLLFLLFDLSNKYEFVKKTPFAPHTKNSIKFFLYKFI